MTQPVQLSAASGKANVLKPPKPIPIGINYPWRGYGWDFGDPPCGWGSQAPWKTHIIQDLEELSKLGIFCVRWFILCDGINYGIGGTPNDKKAPYPDPTPPQWRFDDPPELSVKAKADFEELLKAFQTHNSNPSNRKILFLPSLIDFHWCYPGTFPTDCKLRNCGDANWITKTNGELVCNKKCGRFVKGGRADVIINSQKREKFFDRVLDPLLKISGGYKNHIYAWEIMNEPEWVTDDPSWWNRLLRKLRRSGSEKNKTVSKAMMIDFLKRGIARINNVKGFKSTIGFASSRTLSAWGSMGETLHQFHFYPKSHDPNSKDHSELKAPPHSPCFVGEFATSLDLPVKEDPDPNKSIGPDGKPDWWWLATDDVYHRLKYIQNKGYVSAFPWSGKAGLDRATQWNQNTKTQIKNYTEGK